MRGEIEFSHVTFAYPTGEPVLQDISFTVKPGQTVAIVGQTGTGKTTLMSWSTALTMPVLEKSW